VGAHHGGDPILGSTCVLAVVWDLVNLHPGMLCSDLDPGEGTTTRGQARDTATGYRLLSQYI